MSLRLAVARHAGLDEAAADKIDEDFDRSDLSDRHKAALRFTDAFVTQPGAIDAAQWAELRTHFTDAQIVELALDIMKWSTQKMMVTLGIDPPVTPGEITFFDFDESGAVAWMDTELR